MTNPSDTSGLWLKLLKRFRTGTVLVIIFQSSLDSSIVQTYWKVGNEIPQDTEKITLGMGRSTCVYEKGNLYHIMIILVFISCK